jgi:putative tricarboxylic transport membrane protein
MWESIWAGFLTSLEPFNFFLIVAGITGGIVIGALPGLTATMGVALMVPVTFTMDPVSGLIMLGAIYLGAIYGGANAAILINTPGTPSSVATTFDGWPMCKNGKADEALIAALLASVIGGIVGILFLLFISKPLAIFSLRFGAPEFFWLCIFGLSTIAAMSMNNVIKGLVAGALGILISLIGLDPVQGLPRFTFGYYPLVSGIEIIPAMIGLFSFSQVMYLIGNRKNYIAEYNPKPGALKRVIIEMWTKCKMCLAKSSVIGMIVGVLPGAGGEIASIIAYNETKRWDKDPSRFGKGAIEGVVASETANQALIGGALAPMLTLGIPGSAVAAVMMGGMLAHGIQPGFKIFELENNLAYTFIVSMLVASIVMLFVGYFLIKGTAKVLNLPTSYISVGIVCLCVIGTYAIRNSMLDVAVMLIFGIIGHFCIRVNLDPGAMALGIILGPIVEENLGKSMALAKADGSLFMVFFGNPISLFLIVMTVFSVFAPSILHWIKRGRGQEKGAGDV